MSCMLLTNQMALGFVSFLESVFPPGKLNEITYPMAYLVTFKNGLKGDKGIPCQCILELFLFS